MKKICSILLLAGLKTAVFAQSVAIGGEVPKPYMLDASTMKQMKHVTLNLKGHDGQQHRYSGVLLADVLTQADVTVGEGSAKRVVKSYVLVNAEDKYQAVYAMAEFEPMFTGNQIIVADEVDGKPLPTGTGPFQMIVPGEKKFGRWVRQVKEIKLVTIKE
jgi:hypothetical protein